jgi:Co/Zn/Cd efflux system component
MTCARKARVIDRSPAMASRRPRASREAMNRIQILAAGSVAVGISVLALKYIAYVLTGSLALLSDAIESIVHTLTSSRLSCSR